MILAYEKRWKPTATNNTVINEEELLVKEYQFRLGNKGAAVRFCLSDDGLTMYVEHQKEYTFTFTDALVKDRITFDGYANLEYETIDVYGKNTSVNVKEDTIEFICAPAPKIKIVHQFTPSKVQASIRQQTYFEVDGAVYDCAHYTARAKINAEIFETVGNDDMGTAFVIENLQKSRVGHKGELVLKGKDSYLKVTGGLVAFYANTLDAHANGDRFLDTMALHNQENALFTTYTFEEGCVAEWTRQETGAKDNQPQILTLESGAFRADYILKKDGIAQYHKQSQRPLVALKLRNVKTGEGVFFDTLTGWDCVAVTQKETVTQMELTAPGGIQGIALTMIATAIPEKNRLEWDVAVINDSAEYSLLWCTYPRLYRDCARSSHLLMPENGGTEYCGFSDTDNYYNGSYPGGFFGTMAYMALYTGQKDKNDGVYYAIHDTKGSKKEFQAASTQTGSVCLTCRFYAEEFGKPANTNRLPGKAVWQSFSGDWFDATDIYRDFVRKECFWAKPRIEQRDIPLWMQEIPFWVMDWVPQDSVDGEPIPTNLRTDSDVIREADWYENVICLQKELGVPIGYHVYNWHVIPFNNDYPHFLPAKKSFMAGMKELKKHDIRVMPYINALLWDTKDKGNSNFEFEEQGRPGAVKTEAGKPVSMRYESRESDGKLVELTAMCPSYPLWRKKLSELTFNMFKELDVDAIYLDQVAARIPHLCMDESHNHPVGGGHWWIEEYNALLKELNRHKPADKAFTTECNAEVYAADIDAFLSWAWIRSVSDVPAFMRIYSDVIPVFGRNTNGYMKHADLHWKYHFAQSLLSAQQLGWINADVVKMPDRLEFIKKLIRFRYENKAFFRQATILRPPVVQAEPKHMFASDIGMSHIGVLHKPYICSGALNNGNTYMILLVNIGKRDMTDVIQFNPAEYNPGKSFTVSGYGQAKITADGCMECTVEKESFLCICWEQ